VSRGQNLIRLPSTLPFANFDRRRKSVDLINSQRFSPMGGDRSFSDLRRHLFHEPRLLSPIPAHQLIASRL
jgi:hypothetical protein